MLLIVLFFSTLCCLVGSFFLTALSSAFRRVYKEDLKKELASLGAVFFYRPLHLFFFPDHEYERLFFAIICAQNITRYCYCVLATFFIIFTPFFQGGIVNGIQLSLHEFTIFWVFLTFFWFLLLSFIIGDYLPRLFGTRLSVKALRCSAPVASFFLTAVFPFTYIFLRISQTLSRTIYFDHVQEPIAQAKQEIIDIVQQAELSPELSAHDKKLIESVLTFRELVAREVMVPRVDMFSLAATVSIKEAAILLESEGYSRTPVYRHTVDNIVGVLMYKDVLSKYQEYESKGNDQTVLNAPIETLMKGILYTPETKKLSNLLQEFRKKQVHFAVVVDEYGGTEGIVTIEDILEEIVGDISDEYDEEEALFVPQSDGSWIVDPHMSILDAEEQLGIEIPQEGDYDTIGGYIFHCAGAIPSRGFVIHRDEFEIEILRSNERTLEKVKIRHIRS